MIKTYDLAVKTRSYKDKYGNDKSVWENIGSVMQNEQDGHKFIMLKAYFNLAGFPRKEGSDSISVSMFEPDKNNNQYQNNYQQQNYQYQNYPNQPQDFNNQNHNFESIEDNNFIPF